MRAHVDYITPGIKLLALRTKNQKRQKRDFGVFNKAHNLTQPKTRPMPQSLNSLMTSPLSAICDVAIVPLCIQTLYDITSPTKHAVGNELGIVEALGQMYSQTDLNEFFASLAPNIPQGTHPTLDSVDGGTATVTNLSDAGSESDLDFQVSYPIIYPQNSILFQSDDDVYEANYTYEGLFNNFLDAIDGSYCTYSAYGETGNSPIDPPYPDPQPGGFKGALQCGIYKPTNVISISYAGPEYDAPISYQQRQCNEYMKLGMQGVSVVVSSGDQGVAGALNDDNPNGCLGPNASIFSPAFPASCPYVTSVGATSLPLGGDVAKDEETATTQFPSGGGFSNIFAIPHYQARAIATYFASAGAQHPFYTSINNNSFGANGGVYNRNGRGFPDVSAIGQNVAVVVAGVPVLIGGTSVSSPVFAAVLNRINEERLAVRKRTIGFVNPILVSTVPSSCSCWYERLWGTDKCSSIRIPKSCTTSQWAAIPAAALMVSRLPKVGIR